MTPEQHGSKTEGRGDNLARQERMAECRFCKTVPGNGDAACRTRDDALQCVWLRGGERAHQIERQLHYLDSCNQHLRQKEIGDLQSELSRLHKGGEFPQPQRRDGEPPCGECHLKSGETCDVCEVVSPSDFPAREYARERIASKAALAIRPEAAGDQEYWRIREEISTVLKEEFAAPPSQPEGVREALEAAKDALEALDSEILLTGQLQELTAIALDKIERIGLTTPSRGLVEAAEWQPIETAPKDGTRFLAYCVSRAPFANKPTFTYETARWAEGSSPRTGYFASQSGAIPSHWMPLPAPPRTLSTKPTANAADREGDRDG